jgi:SAM-dependent methyltransferase
MQTFSDSFRSEIAVDHYERFVYEPGNYDTTIWELQKTFLEKWLRVFRESHPRVKCLDFACGTGRVTSVVEEFSDDTLGLDISPEMLAVAAERTVNTQLRHGDILSDPRIADFDYDLITAFRFFLNAEPDLRTRIMQTLAARLRDEGSRLVFNIHGNRRSIRHLSVRAHQKRGERHNEMSIDEVRWLADQTGLEIESWHGFGILPRSLYKTKLCPAARRIDQAAIQWGWLSAVSCDLLFVCRKKRVA